MHYHGPSGQGKFTVSDIAEKITEDINARHLIWTVGWTNWKKWNELPALRDMVNASSPPPVQPARQPSHQNVSTTEVNQMFGRSQQGVAAEAPKYNSIEEAISARGFSEDDED